MKIDDDVIHKICHHHPFVALVDIRDLSRQSV